MKPLSIAFVDDHPILLSGIEHLFSSNSDFRTVGVGVCADDVLQIAEREKPNVIVIDLNMPGNVLEAISELIRTKSKTRVLVFTAVTSVDHAVAALEAGALGYVLKGSSQEDLIDAIQTVHEGKSYITAEFAAKVVSGLHAASLRRESAAALKLSKREEQVLHLLMLGKNNREIAEALSISEKTVKHYMGILMKTLNARNRLEVVLNAQQLGVDGAGEETTHLN